MKTLNLRENVYKESIKDITPLLQLKFALTSYYREPCSISGIAPKNWNPIFLHGIYDVFDPNMVSSINSNIMYNLCQSEVFEPWTGPNGLERTRIFLYMVREKMEEDSYHTNFNVPEDVIKDIRGCLIQDGYEDYIMSLHYITTKEIVTRKSVIIGFYHIASGEYKRYLIKNIKKLCKLFRVYHGEFNRIFGNPPLEKHDPNRIYNKNTTSEELDKKILQLVTDASAIPVTNKHILEMMKELKNPKKVPIKNLYPRAVLYDGSVPLSLF